MIGKVSFKECRFFKEKYWGTTVLVGVRETF